MKSPFRKALVLVSGVAVTLIAGCGQNEPPNVKKSRLIASENIQLKKQLNQSNSEIERLKELHDKQIQEQKNLLEKCQQEQEAWKKKSQQNIRNQVKDVLDAVLEENKKLREENEKLRSQITGLQKEGQDTER